MIQKNYQKLMINYPLIKVLSQIGAGDVRAADTGILLPPQCRITGGSWAGRRCCSGQESEVIQKTSG